MQLMYIHTSMGILLKVILLLSLALEIRSTAISSVKPVKILAVFDEKSGPLWEAVVNEVRLQNLEHEKATDNSHSESCIFRLSVLPVWINNSLSPMESLQALNSALKENRYCSILYTAFSASRIGKVIIEYAFANNIPVINTITEVSYYLKR